MELTHDRVKLLSLLEAVANLWVRLPENWKVTRTCCCTRKISKYLVITVYLMMLLVSETPPLWSSDQSYWL
jgi:hypothetical protein